MTGAHQKNWVAFLCADLFQIDVDGAEIELIGRWIALKNGLLKNVKQVGATCWMTILFFSSFVLLSCTRLEWNFTMPLLTCRNICLLLRDCTWRGLRYKWGRNPPLEMPRKKKNIFHGLPHRSFRLSPTSWRRSTSVSLSQFFSRSPSEEQQHRVFWRYERFCKQLILTVTLISTKKVTSSKGTLRPTVDPTIHAVRTWKTSEDFTTLHFFLL